MIWVEFTLLACLPLVSYLLAQAIGEIDQLQDKVRQLVEQRSDAAKRENRAARRETIYVRALQGITSIGTNNMANIGKRMFTLADAAIREGQKVNGL